MEDIVIDRGNSSMIYMWNMRMDICNYSNLVYLHFDIAWRKNPHAICITAAFWNVENE